MLSVSLPKSPVGRRRAHIRPACWSSASVTALLLTLLALPQAAVHGAARGTALPGTLYFTRAGRLYASAPDGSGARALTSTGTPKNPDMMPAVTRDGRSVAYVQYHEVSHTQPYGIYVIGPDGSRRDISGADQFPFHPAWSPDGSELAYDTTVYGYGVTYNAVVIRRVADRKAVDLIGSMYAAPSAPTWSPDGRTIVVAQLHMVGHTFVTSLEALDYAAMLASAHPTTEIVRHLTQDTAHDYEAPSYSPDGRFIASVRVPHGKQDGDLWIMHADGSGSHAIASGVHWDRPAWSPDGTAIAITRGTSVVIVSAATGTPLVTIPQATGPAWGGRITAPAPVTAPSSASVTPTAGAAVTILNTRLFHQVNGQYEQTKTIHAHEQALFVAYYHVSGAASTAVKGTLTLVYKSRALHSYGLVASKTTSGQPALSVRLNFPSTSGAQRFTLTAQFTVRAGTATATARLPFTLEQ